MWIQIARPAPVLNTSDFAFAFGGATGKEIPLDAKGHPYCFEFAALEGTLFRVRSEIPQPGFSIYEAEAPFYPHAPLFIDSRFAEKASRPVSRGMPPAEEILKGMETLTGTQYVWGGNWSRGIPETLRYYPPQQTLDSKTEAYWTLKGVDCSGLLYETTGGLTPRNTSQLIRFGKPLKTSSLKIGELLQQLRPLDLILYPGHVLFVLNPTTSIESKYPFGVIQRNLRERIDELLEERSLVDECTDDLDANRHFMVRRAFF